MKFMNVLLGKNYQQKSLKLTASLPLKINDWKIHFLLGFGHFEGSVRERIFVKKTRLTPNRNPTYNNKYFLDILVLTIG